MRLIDGALRVSATDLSGFLACKHLTVLKLAKANRVAGLPREGAGYAALADLERRGLEHEDEVLDRYRREFSTLVEIPKEGSDDERTELTRRAMDDEVDVIYQGVLSWQGQFGAPDFLVRAGAFGGETPGDGYEVVDAKLARAAKVAAVLQTTFYSRLLGSITGLTPECMHLELGDGTRETLRVADYAAYERATYARLRSMLDSGPPTLPINDPYPEKVEHCAICSWRGACRVRREEDDDLSLVAGASLKPRLALKAAGIRTLTALAALPAERQFDGMSDDTLRKLRLQAAAQRQTVDPEVPYWEYADEDDVLRELVDEARKHHDPNQTIRKPLRGLFALPAPSPGDLFFDLEAARFFGGGAGGFGLEYLFGFVETLVGRPQYLARWAFNRDEEKAAFEWFVQFVHDRWRAHPDMHVYHYNHYEPTAMDRLAERHLTMAEMLGGLMGRFAVKEDETDALLRNRVFVDVYPAFRQSIRAGIGSYSLKQTEKVAGYRRSQPLDEADEYMFAFQRSLEAGADDARAATDAQAIIAAYNEDDCRATLHLRDWLEERRSELQTRLGQEIPRPPRVEIEVIPETDIEGLKTDLREPVADESGEWNRARSLLADLLEFQRRDERPGWWEYFNLRSLDDEGLFESRHALAGLTYKGTVLDHADTPSKLGKRFIHEFSFPPQEHSVDEGDKLHDPREFHMDEDLDDNGDIRTSIKDGPAWQIVSIDDVAGIVQAAVSSETPDPPPRAFVTGSPWFPKTPSESLVRLAEEVRADGLMSSRLAGSRLLLREQPALMNGGLLPPTEEPVSAFAVEIAQGLDPTYLPIQGAPGTGKTYTGAEIAVALATGEPKRRVGVTGPSHQAIRNFLEELADRRAHHGIGLRIAQYGAKGEISDVVDEYFTNAQKARDALDAGDVDVLGGTTWLWSGPLLQESVDTLIVDEAGQVSLAYAVASAAATRHSMILLGDPQQLAQVSQGTHPEGAGVSALEHVLQDEPVMPKGRGLFIDRTRRMHDLITEFVSDCFYRGELEVDPELHLDLQEVLGPASPRGSGLRVVDVPHAGNDSSSIEEARAVAQLVASLTGRTWVDAGGARRELTQHDVMVVTPYNSQIREIGRALAAIGAPRVRIGTVDGFQGGQAPVVLYSMATSTADEAPRGMEFLYQLNRLNVAVSRAQALAIVVMSPELVRVDCKTPRQMHLANALCLLRERAGQVRPDNPSDEM